MLSRLWKHPAVLINCHAGSEGRLRRGLETSSGSILAGVASAAECHGAAAATATKCSAAAQRRAVPEDSGDFHRLSLSFSFELDLV